MKHEKQLYFDNSPLNLKEVSKEELEKFYIPIYSQLNKINMKNKIAQQLQKYFIEKYNLKIPLDKFQIKPTNSKFEGDYTLAVFSLTKVIRASLSSCGKEIGDKLMKMIPELESYNVNKGFLNLKLK